MEFRECGECDLCCRWLSHDVYGQLVSPNNPCRFIKNGCSIHKNRPAQCKRYFCMWAQGVLPEWMYPKDIGVMVTVKNWPQGQWFEVVECGVQKNLKIVDLTGAGDLFAAGFLHGHVNNLSIKESLEKGTDMSSKVIQQIGARL